MNILQKLSCNLLLKLFIVNDYRRDDEIKNRVTDTWQLLRKHDTDLIYLALTPNKVGQGQQKGKDN